MKACDKKLKGEFMLQILTSTSHSQKCYIFPFSLITESRVFHYGCCWETEEK